jgi:nucleotide-binding universal stress UspA family protein
VYKNILAAVDGSAHGTAVVEAVASLAKLAGAGVHVIHIRPSQVIGGAISSTVVPVEEQAESRKVVDDALERLRADGITADGEVDEGLREDVAAILVERADALGADLIAVGPGHYSGISALLHPSVSRGVAKTSRVGPAGPQRRLTAPLPHPPAPAPPPRCGRGRARARRRRGQTRPEGHPGGVREWRPGAGRARPAPARPVSRARRAS